jgi:PhnB protein
MSEIPRSVDLQVSPYLSFSGQCEAAFKFYEQHLRATPGQMFRYEGSPMAKNVPPDWQHKIMHGSVTIGQLVLMGADVASEPYHKRAGFSLSIQMQDTSEAERIFHALSENGAVLVPLAETFWAARFGMVIDQFGIPWAINCGEPPSEDEKVH